MQTAPAKLRAYVQDAALREIAYSLDTEAGSLVKI
jgi:hypothetical protein